MKIGKPDNNADDGVVCGAEVGASIGIEIMFDATFAARDAYDGCGVWSDLATRLGEEYVIGSIAGEIAFGEDAQFFLGEANSSRGDSKRPARPGEFASEYQKTAGRADENDVRCEHDTEP